MGNPLHTYDIAAKMKNHANKSGLQGMCSYQWWETGLYWK